MESEEFDFNILAEDTVTNIEEDQEEVSQLQSPVKDGIKARPKITNDDFSLDQPKLSKPKQTQPRRLRSNSENTDNQQNTLFGMNSNRIPKNKNTHISPELESNVNLFKK